MEHTWEQTHLPLGKIVKKRCKLVIRLGAKTAKAGCDARGRGLVGGVRSGKGTSRSWCRPQRPKVRIAFCTDRGSSAEAGYLLTADRLKVRKHLLEPVGTGHRNHT